MCNDCGCQKILNNWQNVLARQSRIYYKLSLVCCKGPSLCWSLEASHSFWHFQQHHSAVYVGQFNTLARSERVRSLCRRRSGCSERHSSCPGLLSRFGRHDISVGFKDYSRRQTWLPFRDLHHDPVEMKHCYDIQTCEDHTTVEYNLDLETFFHAMAILNSAVRFAMLVEGKGQPAVFSIPKDRLMVMSLV